MNSLKRIDGHYQVALLWRCDPPFLPNNRKMAERRCALLKKRLQSDSDFLVEYTTVMNDFIDNRHAEQVPKEKLKAEGKTMPYLPHRPVRNPLKKNRQRVVFDWVEGVVSKETVVLRRWGSSIQKFGFINGVDNVNWPPYRDSKS